MTAETVTMRFFWAGGRMEDRVVPFPPPPLWTLTFGFRSTPLVFDGDGLPTCEASFEMATFKLHELRMEGTLPFEEAIREPDENMTWKVGLKDGWYEEV